MRRRAGSAFITCCARTSIARDVVLKDLIPPTVDVDVKVSVRGAEVVVPFRSRSA